MICLLIFYRHSCHIVFFAVRNLFDSYFQCFDLLLLFVIFPNLNSINFFFFSENIINLVLNHFSEKKL